MLASHMLILSRYGSVFSHMLSKVKVANNNFTSLLDKGIKQIREKGDWWLLMSVQRKSFFGSQLG